MGVVPGPVAKKVCADTQTTCEVYIQKDANIKTCRQFCEANGMNCTAQYDGDASCSRDTYDSQYGTCDEEGGSTPDHICECGGASAGKLLPPTR